MARGPPVRFTEVLCRDPGHVRERGVHGQPLRPRDRDVLIGAAGFAGQAQHRIAVLQQSFGRGIHDLDRQADPSGSRYRVLPLDEIAGIVVDGTDEASVPTLDALTDRGVRLLRAD